MKALPYDDVSYCMYGFRYQKTTRHLEQPALGSQPTSLFQAADAAKPSKTAGTPKRPRGRAAGIGLARPVSSCTPCHPGRSRRA